MLLVALGAQLFLGSPVVLSAGRTYPRGFLWGAAWNHHSVEGMAGGGEQGDWWQWEHPTHGSSPVFQGETADSAADHWNRFPDDLEIAHGMGLTSVRFSVAWEKIEPTPGVFSSLALKHYRSVLVEARRQGLRPVIALHHFTHPQWFHDRGGWVSPEAPRIFLRYAETVVRELGDLCDTWITFADPVSLFLMGYLKGQHPPGLADLNGTYEASYQMARAHRIVAAMIHDRQGYSPGAHDPGGSALRGVGLSIRADLYTPFDPANPKDLQATSVLTDLVNWSFPRGIATGVMRYEVPAEVAPGRRYERPLPISDLPPWDVGPPIDWLGLEYFSRFVVRYDARSPQGFELSFGRGPYADNGWAIHADGLEITLREAAKRFALPLVVTANGWSDGQDVKRPQAIIEHLRALDRAVFGSGMGTPLDLRGYFHSSLIDGFEWLRGYADPTGLVAVRRERNFQRVPRASSRTYAREIQRSYRRVP